MKYHLTTTLTAFSLALTPADAAWLLIDDFESYAAGSAVNGQGGWTADGDTNFLADPTNAANQTLNSAETATVTTTNVYHSIPTIDTASIGTIFFRARAADPADFVVGGSDVVAPSNWPDFEGYMRFAGGNVDVRDGGGFANVGTYTADEWYNVWLVLDHTTDTTTIYYNQGLDDAGAAAGSGAFRTSGNPDHEDIINLFVRNNDATNSGYIDDVYVDVAGANTTNPIPEPTAPMLLALAAAMGLRRRR